jgi:uncharacterized phage protein (TIGR01671 family)
MSNREIKFRAWGGSRMHYNVLAGHGDYVADHEDDAIWWWHEPPKAIMQYTGLKDKNGKEVYEDDIVVVTGWSPETYVIKFIEGGFCATNDARLKGSPIDINIMYPSTGCMFTVVGNIHENPDMIPQ